MPYGSEQSIIETDPIKRLAFKWIGITHLGERSRHHYLVRALQKMTLPRDAHVLNAGSANGAHSFYLARHFPGWEIHGVEINPEKVERACEIARMKGVGNVHFETRDLRKIDFVDCFDMVFSMHVLTFVREDRQVLKRFYRALKQGGYLILSVPTPPGPLRLPWLRSKASPCGEEGIGYTNEEIGRKVDEAGFHPVSLLNPAGLFGQLAWEVSSALEQKRFLRIPVYPSLILLVELDRWIENEASFPKGRDCLVISRK